MHSKNNKQTNIVLVLSIDTYLYYNSVVLIVVRLASQQIGVWVLITYVMKLSTDVIHAKITVHTGKKLTFCELIILG